MLLAGLYLPGSGPGHDEDLHQLNTGADRHGQSPRYVSTMGLCFAVPFILSPLVGKLIDVIGFQPIFLAISGLIGVGALLTFRMAEPRHSQTS